MVTRGEEKGAREFGMDMYTLLYLKWMTSKNLLYIAHGTLLNVMWQPGWERDLGENACVCESPSVVSTSSGLTLFLMTLVLFFTPTRDTEGE